MTVRRKIELLSPAKNADIGMEAINHGADAVYIGAPRFGARASAGNSVGDIERLATYAHSFGARVYVALNTILRDDELEEARVIAYELYNAGADALIVQDMGLLQLDLPPIALHASTQTDNRTVEKVRFLADAGFSQVVLARELSLQQIRDIHRAVDVPLEVFVHGALCVSYSGQCYMSAAACGRSANRGECAQYCRLPYTLTDADGRVLVRDKHLLSLKDLNQSDRLEDLLDAGVSSLKIEGRLKELSYVKNVTAYYRLRLDEIFKRREEFARSSGGHTELFFTPDVSKSFNRSFTHYFLDGRTSEAIISPDTPKSVGEFVGVVKSVADRFITVSGVHSFSNGDGIGFINRKGVFEGFRVNRVEGNRLFPGQMPDISPKTRLYRNYNHEFEKALSRKSAERFLYVDITLYDTAFGFALEMTDETGVQATMSWECTKEVARTLQLENQQRLLSKLGDTVFRVRNIEVRLEENWFIPSSVLADMRRCVVERLMLARRIAFRRDVRKDVDKQRPVFPVKELSYLGNVANGKASEFYAQCGVRSVQPAFEVSSQGNVPLMFTRHCIKYMQGWCPKLVRRGDVPKEPLFLSYKDSRFRLEFDCRLCEMKIYKE